MLLLVKEHGSKMEIFKDGRIVLYPGDCMEVIKTLPDNSIDSVVTDPPYALVSIVKRFGKTSVDDNNQTGERCAGRLDPYARGARGFMGKQWDNGETAFNEVFWSEVMRVLKPGGHMAVFGGTRTAHRMVCAIEDAGFEIRDSLAWVYGSGFPKSHDVSKGIDKAAGAEREVVSENVNRRPAHKHGGAGFDAALGQTPLEAMNITAPATDAAKQWDGWGTALKPALEKICLAQKPFKDSDLYGIIGSNLDALERRIWSILPANVAEKFSMPSQGGLGEVECDSAQWNAERRFSIQDALFGQTDTWQSAVTVLISSLNTVSSWKTCLAESLRHASMSTIETELSTIIDLKIWKSCLSKITPESIIQAHRLSAWSSADASPAERYLNAAAAKWHSIRELSVAENAINSGLISPMDGIGEITPNLSEICLARKPLSEKTVAANVLKWGVGAINVGACRIPTTGRPKVSEGWDRPWMHDPEVTER